MTSFRTPLFISLVVLLMMAALAGRMGFFDQHPLEKKDFSSQYALAQGTFEQNIGKLWLVSLDRLGSERWKGKAMMALTEPSMILDLRISPGARWQGWVRPLQKNQGYQGLKSTEDWLSRYGASIRLAVDNPQDLDITPADQGVMVLFFRLKTMLARRIENSFKNPQEAGLLGGIILGEKRLLDSSLKQEFADVGVAHLLVVSGMHVSLWAAMMWWLAVYLLRLGPKKAAVISAAATWCFAAVVGLTPPVIRSAVMMSFLVAAPLLRRELPAMARLLAAALVMLFVKPAWSMDASFQLSLVATFGVLYGWEVLEHWWVPERAWVRYVSSVLMTSFFAWYAVWPVTVAWFHQVSVIGPLANVILVPASGILLALGVLQMVVLDWIPYVGYGGHAVLQWALQGFLAVVEWMDKWPWASIGQESWQWWQYGLWAMALAVPMAHVIRKKLVIAMVALSVVGISQELIKPGKLYLLSGYSGLEAVYEQRGWRRHLCVDQDMEEAIPARLRDFLTARGAQKLGSACTQALLTQEKSLFWKPAAPWIQGQRQPMFRCGLETVVYPLTVIFEEPRAEFGIIADEPSSRVLECRQGQFVEVFS